MAIGDKKPVERKSNTRITLLLVVITIVIVVFLVGIGVLVGVLVYGDNAKDGPKHKKPNIVFILADDLGYGDIGYNNAEVLTPTLDELATGPYGRILTSSYALPMCTPSRHGLMTGRHPYKSMLQHKPVEPGNPHCSPINLKFLPQRLRDVGYNTHMVGKWHLGFCSEKCTPTYRGLETFYGYYGIMVDYWNHTFGPFYDWHDDKESLLKVDFDTHGIYTTDLLTKRAKEVIENQEEGKPLFLMVSHEAPHYPYQAHQRLIDKYSSVQNPGRRTFLGMVSSIDESTKEIVDALKAAGMYNDTLIIFSSDNGGETGVLGAGAVSDNRPLRGGKMALWEGGTRVVNFVHSPKLNKAGTEHDGLFHIIDWTPTLVALAGGKIDDPDAIDGLDQAEMVINGSESVRKEFVYNIDMEPLPLNGQSAIRVGDYKMMWGFEGYADGYSAKGEMSPFYARPEYLAVWNSSGELPEIPAHINYPMTPKNYHAITGIMAAKVFNPEDINSGQVHLFNIKDDPKEENDLATDSSYSSKILELKQKLLDLIKTKYRAPPSYAYTINPKEMEIAREHGAWYPGSCDNNPLYTLTVSLK